MRKTLKKTRPHTKVKPNYLGLLLDFGKILAPKEIYQELIEKKKSGPTVGQAGNPGACVCVCACTCVCVTRKIVSTLNQARAQASLRVSPCLMLPCQLMMLTIFMQKGENFPQDGRREREREQHSYVLLLLLLPSSAHASPCQTTWHHQLFRPVGLGGKEEEEEKRRRRSKCSFFLELGPSKERERERETRRKDGGKFSFVFFFFFFFPKKREGGGETNIYFSQILVFVQL